MAESPIWFVDNGKGGGNINPGMLAFDASQQNRFIVIHDGGKPETGYNYFRYSPERGFYAKTSDILIDNLLYAIIAESSLGEPFAMKLMGTNKLKDARILLKNVALRKKLLENTIEGDAAIINPEQWISFRNGDLNVEEMILYPHDPERYLTRQIACDWHQEASEPKVFLQFMHRLLTGDPSPWKLEDALQNKMFEVILEYIGLSISNVRGFRFKKALFFWGVGDSGKSQLLELMHYLMGNDNYAAVDMQGLEERFGKSCLYNKRIAGDPDMKALRLNDVRTFKNLTGGDTVEIEFKGIDKFQYKYDGVLWFCCNIKPKFGGDDGQHVFDRMLLVHCEHRVPVKEQDRHLLDKLMSEASSITNISIHALKRLLDRGCFDEPEEIIRARRDYEKENSNVLSWIEDNCIEITGGKSGLDEYLKTSGMKVMTVRAMYENYTNWCKTYSGGYAKQMTDWRAALESRYCKRWDDIAVKLPDGIVLLCIALNREEYRRTHPDNFYGDM